MQYAKKAGYHVGAKYTMGIGGEMGTKYLKKNHSEYRELQVKAMRIVEENPALRTLINCMEGIVLTPEDHKALHKLKNAIDCSFFCT